MRICENFGEFYYILLSDCLIYMFGDYFDTLYIFTYVDTYYLIIYIGKSDLYATLFLFGFSYFLRDKFFKR